MSLGSAPLGLLSYSSFTLNFRLNFYNWGGLNNWVTHNF